MAIHVAAGFSGLIGAVMMGPLQGQGDTQSPSNLPLFALGVGLLCVGFTALVGGGSLPADASAALALITVQCCVSAAAMTWLFLDWASGKLSLISIGAGACCGLAAIASGAASVSPIGAIAIGAIAAVLSRCVVYSAQTSCMHTTRMLY